MPSTVTSPVRSASMRSYFPQANVNFRRDTGVTSAIRFSQDQPAPAISARDADVNLPVPHLALDAPQTHSGVAGVAAGLDVELVSMPWADHVPPLGKPQTRALLV